MVLLFFLKATGLLALTAVLWMAERGNWAVLWMAIPLGMMWYATRQHARRRARESARP